MKSLTIVIAFVILSFVALVQVQAALTQANSVHDFLRDDPYTVKNFTQRINAFDPFNLNTFQQRYYIDDSAFKPGSPIFLYIGAEAPIEYYWFSSGVTFRAMANKANALKLFIEHRQYGTSLLPSNTHLTVEHAIEDVAVILQAIVAQYLPEGSAFPQVVAAGGSFAGMLASYARVRYPHLIHAVIASSTPFRMVGQQWEISRLNYAYFYHVTNDFRAYNHRCPKIVSSAFYQLNEFFKAKNYTAIQQSLNICEPVNDYDSYEQMVGWIRSAFVDMAQGNNPQDDPKYSYPVFRVCDMLLETPEQPLVGMAKALDFMFEHEMMTAQSAKFWNKNQNQLRHWLSGQPTQVRSKIDFSHVLPLRRNGQCHKMYEEYQACADVTGCGGDVAWDFQVCTQATIAQSCDCSCMFPGSFHGIKEHAEYCQKTFNVDIEKIGAFGRLGLAFPGADWRATSNIIFSQGIDDPWCDGGILESQSPTLIALTARNGSHHYDLNRPTRNDSPDIAGLRDLEYDIIMEMAKVGGPDLNKMKQFQKIVDEKYPAGCYDDE